MDTQSHAVVSRLHMSVPPSSLSSLSSTSTSQVTLPIKKHCADPQNEEYGSVAKTTSSTGYVKSIPPTEENWLRKHYKYSMKNDVVSPWSLRRLSLLVVFSLGLLLYWVFAYFIGAFLQVFPLDSLFVEISLSEVTSDKSSKLSAHQISIRSCRGQVLQAERSSNLRLQLPRISPPS